MSITRVNTNFDAIFATNALRGTELQMQNAMARISSGKRINYASDDPTGVGQLTMAKASLGGARVAQQNAQEDLAFLQFADGVMQTFEDKLIELRDIALRGANDATLNDAQAQSLANSYNNVIAAAGELGSTRMDVVEWNGKAIFSAAVAANPYTFQFGGQATDMFTINIATLNTDTVLGVTTTLATTSAAIAATATAALGELDTALDTMASERSNVGIAMQRLQYGLEEQMNMEVNYASAVSTIGDADMATEISKLTTAQILSQSGAAMLGQANIQAQTLLNILM